MLKFELAEIVKTKVTGDIGKLCYPEMTQGADMRFLKAGTGRFSSERLPIVTKNDVLEATLAEKIIYLKLEFHGADIVETTVINDGEYIIFKALWVRKNKVSYHTFLNFKDACRGYELFDSALIGLVAQKYLGSNSGEAGILIGRMLKMPDSED